MSDTHQRESACLKNTVCYPERARLAQGAGSQHRTPPTQSPPQEPALGQRKQHPVSGRPAVAAGRSCRPARRCPGRGGGCRSGGGFLLDSWQPWGSLGNHSQCTLGLQEVWGRCGGEGAPCSSGTCQACRPSKKGFIPI